MYGRPLDSTIKWIEQKFASKASVANANVLALKSGFNYGETAEMFTVRYVVPKAKIAPVMTPGRINGKVTLKKTLRGLAPSPVAARIRF